MSVHAEIPLDPQLLVENASPLSAEQALPFVEHKLRAGQPFTIADASTMYDPDDVKTALGFKAAVPAVIQAADKELWVVDITRYSWLPSRSFREVSPGQHFNADYLLVDPETFHLDQSQVGYKGIRSNPVTFGRDGDAAERFGDLSSKVSRRHFEIVSEPHGLLVTDLYSRNGTTVKTTAHQAYANRTADVINRVRSTGGYSEPTYETPHGSFNGDPIIGRMSTSVKGGIYLGGGIREAIAVKPDQDPRIEAVYSRMMGSSKARQFGRVVFGRSKQPEDFYKQVLETVRSVMPYDGPAVKAFSRQFYGDQQVSLGDYIEQRIGVCRHQALLSAYLLERLKDDGLLQGNIAVERNTVPDFGGSHAWATFKQYNGTDYVVDAAQNFVGTKSEARRIPGRWDYYVPLTQ